MFCLKIGRGINHDQSVLVIGHRNRELGGLPPIEEIIRAGLLTEPQENSVKVGAFRRECSFKRRIVVNR